MIDLPNGSLSDFLTINSFLQILRDLASGSENYDLVENIALVILMQRVSEAPAKNPKAAIHPGQNVSFLLENPYDCREIRHCHL